MTRDDVLRMAREAGVVADSPYLVPHDYQLNALERFATLVAAAERESCANVLERYGNAFDQGDTRRDMHKLFGSIHAYAIRNSPVFTPTDSASTAS